MSENKLNNGGVKTTIDQSAVATGEQVDVNLNLDAEDEKSGNGKGKKKKKDNKNSKELKSTEKIEVKKSDAEVKSMNMKLLNLL